MSAAAASMGCGEFRTLPCNWIYNGLRRNLTYHIQPAGPDMTTAFEIYITLWSALCLAALLAFLRWPAAFYIGQRSYWHFLTERWKAATFCAGAALVTLIAPYTGDPTWDHVDGFFMSVLCYATAPWVVAVLYLAAKGRASTAEIYVAVCTWLFSASWSYDIYLVWRDGHYPATWLPNLFASSLIYLCAGLFWNLEWVPERGVIFSFMRDGWPSRPASSAPARLIVYALVLALPIIAAIVIFFL